MPEAPRLRRPRAITLVLLGTAALSLGACESRETRCIRARAENRPDAEAICAAGSSSSSSSRSGTSWFGYSGSSGSSTGAGTSGFSGSSARGGFGGTSSSAGG